VFGDDSDSENETSKKKPIQVFIDIINYKQKMFCVITIIKYFRCVSFWTHKNSDFEIVFNRLCCI